MSKLRLAGNALKWLFSKPGAVKGTSESIGKLELALRLAPDLVGAGITAAVTPGDIGDKAIASGTQLIGGTVTGLAAGRAFRNPLLSGTADTIASIAGDFASMPVADALMRGKDSVLGGKGQTPYERLSEEQQRMLAQNIERQVLQAYGLLPGTRDQYLQDPTTGMRVS